MTTIPQLAAPTWFVGCGNMGGAIVKGWQAAGLDLSNLVIVDPNVEIDGVRSVKTLAEAGPPPKLVILGFKPQMLDEVSGQLKNWLTSKAVVVSILAGVEIASLKQRFPKAGAIVRAMPNLPVAIRRGVVALYSEDADDAQRKQIAEIMAPLGFAPWMPDEVKFAAVGSISGPGPAFVARFIEALRKAGEEWGLSNQIASVIALETVLGTAWMAATSGEKMDEIIRRVASPNGTTAAGLSVLDRDGVLDQLVSVTIEAAARRGAELAEEAKSAKLAEPARLH